MGVRFLTNVPAASDQSTAFSDYYQPPQTPARQSFMAPDAAVAPLPSVTSFYTPPRPQPQQPSNSKAESQVIAFHSPSKWKVYFESSKSSNKLVVIDFTAAWCGPCRKMEPAFNDLAATYTDVDFVKIDVDELMDAARHFGVQAMPLFLFLKRGEQIDKVVGPKKEELRLKTESHRALYY